MWKKARYYRNKTGEIEQLDGIFITEFGEVKNIKRDPRKGEIISPLTNRGGYKYIKIDNKNYLLHVLLLSTFSTCPTEKDYQVDHVDRNKTNNSLNNLKFVTRSQNQKNKNKYIKPKIFLVINKNTRHIEQQYDSRQLSTFQKDYLTQRELPNIDRTINLSLSLSLDLYEKVNDTNYSYLNLDSILDNTYLVTPDPKVSISNLGILKRRFNYGFHYTLGTLNKRYYSHTLKLPPEYSSFTHGLVINIFNKDLFDTTKYVVDHINCNSQDNRLENLRVVTQKENINNVNSLNKIRIPIKCKNGSKTVFFRGLTECAKLIGLKHPGSICDWLKNRYKCTLKNFSDFEYLTEDEIKNKDLIHFIESSDELIFMDAEDTAQN